MSKFVVVSEGKKVTLEVKGRKKITKTPRTIVEYLDDAVQLMDELVSEVEETNPSLETLTLLTTLHGYLEGGLMYYKYKK